jgi:hypothetical protein
MARAIDGYQEITLQNHGLGRVRIRWARAGGAPKYIYFMHPRRVDQGFALIFKALA